MKIFSQALSASLCSLLAVGTVACGLGPLERDRDENDRATEGGPPPWQVSIQRYGLDGTHSCSGSVIDEDWILTAAHCVDGRAAQSLQVVAGISRLSESAAAGQIRGVERIITFPNYESPENGGDIALLQLAEPLDLSASLVSAIALAAPEDLEPVEVEVPVEPETGTDTGTGTGTGAGAEAETTVIEVSREAIVSGWGPESSAADELTQEAVPLLTESQALDVFGIELLSDQVAVEPIVAGSGLCRVDGGAPLVVESPEGSLLAGVSSWGTTCEEEEHPAVFSRIPSFAEWIDNETSSMSEGPSASCEGHCGDRAPSGCRCDGLCVADGNCCSDYQEQCSG